MSWFQTAVIIPFVFSTSITALGFSCEQVVADKVLFNLQPLAGIHSVVSPAFPADPGMANWTITLNLCASLNIDKDKKADHQCPQGTRGELFDFASQANMISMCIETDLGGGRTAKRTLGSFGR
jgi:hypothetical protein